MSIDYVSIGAAPSAEDCLPAGHEGCRAESVRFRDLLRRAFPAPDGSEGACSLRVKSFPHDFGSYLEVCAFYVDDDEAAAEWAFNIESEAPETWDELQALADRVSPIAAAAVPAGWDCV